MWDESRGSTVVVYDLYDMLTECEIDEITLIMNECAARNGIVLDIWEPIIQVETDEEVAQVPTQIHRSLL